MDDDGAPNLYEKLKAIRMKLEDRNFLKVRPKESSLEMHSGRSSHHDVERNTNSASGQKEMDQVNEKVEQMITDAFFD